LVAGEKSKIQLRSDAPRLVTAQRFATACGNYAVLMAALIARAGTTPGRCGQGLQMRITCNTFSAIRP
jgi:hypothetical protein